MPLRFMENINKQELSRKPLIRRIRHKLCGHDWEVVKEEHEYKRPMDKYDPTSRKVLKCTDCKLEQEQFFSKIFYCWLPGL